MRERVPATGYSLAPTPGTALPKTDTRYLRYLSSRRFSEFDCLPSSAQLQEAKVDLRAAGEDSYSPAIRSPPSESSYFFVRPLFTSKEAQETSAAARLSACSSHPPSPEQGQNAGARHMTWLRASRGAGISIKIIVLCTKLLHLLILFNLR